MPDAKATRECHFIVNPHSGSMKVHTVLNRIIRRLGREGQCCNVHFTRFAGHATQIAEGLPHPCRVIAVGGDGTVREVAAGLIDTDSQLAIFPNGTENLVARHLGHRPDVEYLHSLLVNGHPMKIDVGQANGHLFLVVTGVGFDAQVVLELARQRGGHIYKSDYFWPLWRTFWGHRFPRLVIQVDGETVFDDHGLAMVGNIPRYGLGLPIFKHGDEADGMLDVCIYPTRGKPKLLIHAVRTLMGVHTRWGDAMYRQGKTVSIHSSETVPIEMDGDTAGYLPVRCQLHDSQLTVLRL